MKNISRKFGKRVQSLRRERGIIQNELAREIGVDRTYIVKIERGDQNPTLQVITRLADALDVSVEDLFAFPEENNIAHGDELPD